MIYLDPWRQGSILSIYSHIHTNMLTDTMFGLPSDPYSDMGMELLLSVCSTKPHLYTVSFLEMSTRFIHDTSSMSVLCVYVYVFMSI